MFSPDEVVARLQGTDVGDVVVIEFASLHGVARVCWRRASSGWSEKPKSRRPRGDGAFDVGFHRAGRVATTNGVWCRSISPGMAGLSWAGGQ